MRIPVISLLLLAGVTLCSGAIDIKGVVTANGGTPVSGATVRLEKLGLTTTSGTDGGFSLYSNSVHDSVSTLDMRTGGVSQPMSVQALRGFLLLHLPGAGPVEIATFTVQGKLAFHKKVLAQSGVTRVPLPDLGAGIYIHTITYRGTELKLKHNTMIQGGIQESVGSSTPPDAASMSKESQAASWVADGVILVKKNRIC